MKTEKLDGRIGAIMEGYEAEEAFFTQSRTIFPRRSVVYRLVEEIRALMFPGYFDDDSLAGESNNTLVGERLMRRWTRMRLRHARRRSRTSSWTSSRACSACF